MVHIIWASFLLEASMGYDSFSGGMEWNGIVIEGGGLMCINRVMMGKLVACSGCLLVPKYSEYRRYYGIIAGSA